MCTEPRHPVSFSKLHVHFTAAHSNHYHYPTTTFPPSPLLQAREADEERTLSRKRNLLVLILHYLNDEGYLDSAHSLEAEASISLNRYDVCDNIDLETVLQEYESYYYVKFQKYPKVVKKVTESAPEAGANKVGCVHMQKCLMILMSLYTA